MPKRMIIPKKDWPDVLRLPVVKGIHVGGCIDLLDDSFDGTVWAHAHNSPNESMPGWICFESKYLLLLKFECLHLHELAHLVSSKCGHNKIFRRALLSIGGKLNGCYVSHNGRRIHFPPE
jgi:hypothetical protein